MGRRAQFSPPQKAFEIHSSALTSCWCSGGCCVSRGLNGSWTKFGFLLSTVLLSSIDKVVEWDDSLFNGAVVALFLLTAVEVQKSRRKAVRFGSMHIQGQSWSEIHLLNTFPWRMMVNQICNMPLCGGFFFFKWRFPNPTVLLASVSTHLLTLPLANPVCSVPLAFGWLPFPSCADVDLGTQKL